MKTAAKTTCRHPKAARKRSHVLTAQDFGLVVVKSEVCARCRYFRPLGTRRWKATTRAKGAKGSFATAPPGESEPERGTGNMGWSSTPDHVPARALVWLADQIERDAKAAKKLADKLAAEGNKSLAHLWFVIANRDRNNAKRLRRRATQRAERP